VLHHGKKIPKVNTARIGPLRAPRKTKPIWRIVVLMFCMQNAYIIARNPNVTTANQEERF